MAEETRERSKLAIVTDSRSHPHDGSLACSQPVADAHEALITYGFDMRVIERSVRIRALSIERARGLRDVYRLFHGSRERVRRQIERGGTLETIRSECIILLATGVLFSRGLTASNYKLELLLVSCGWYALEQSKEKRAPLSPKSAFSRRNSEYKKREK